MYSAIRKINRELGCAVMMVTHDIGCAVREADKMLSMCRGHYFFGDVAEYLRHEKHDEEVHEHAEEEYHHHSKDCLFYTSGAPVDIPDFTRGMWTQRSDKNHGFYRLDR